MTKPKDEMQRECEQCVEDCLHARFDVGVGNIDAEEWNEKVAAKNTAFDAYALADTLGMLEAHVGSHFKDEVSYRRFDEEGGNLIVGLMRGEQGELIWWGGHFDRNGWTTVAISTRAEAEALLAGEEKKE